MLKGSYHLGARVIEYQLASPRAGRANWLTEITIKLMDNNTRPARLIARPGCPFGDKKFHYAIKR
jgi:hypothetical protein